MCACRVDYGHAEAAHKYGSDPRKYNVMSKKFVTDDQGHVRVSDQAFWMLSYSALSLIKTLLAVICCESVCCLSSVSTGSSLGACHGVCVSVQPALHSGLASRQL